MQHARSGISLDEEGLRLTLNWGPIPIPRPFSGSDSSNSKPSMSLCGALGPPICPYSTLRSSAFAQNVMRTTTAPHPHPSATPHRTE
jgi:hypothetical protein